MHSSIAMGTRVSTSAAAVTNPCRCRPRPWSPAFMAAYEQALGGAPALIGADRHDPGSVDAVITAYLNSKQFSDDLAATTQRMRRALLKRFTAEHGDKRLAMLEPRHVARIRAPGEAHAQGTMRRAWRGLRALASAGRITSVAPPAGYKRKRPKDTGGSRPWTEEGVAAFVSRRPAGSKARLALMLLLC